MEVGFFSFFSFVKFVKFVVMLDVYTHAFHLLAR
jgi:hypothetical protein